MEEKTVTQITMEKIIAEVKAPLEARIRKLEAALANKDAALRAADKMNEVLNSSSSGHFWADLADAQEEYMAARAALTEGAKV